MGQTSRQAVSWEQRLEEILRASHDARWRVTTVTRVGRKLGVHKAIRWPGAARLLRELSRGKVNASTGFRFQAANAPDRTALVQAGLPGRKERGVAEARRLSYGELDRLADRIAAALVRRGIGRGSAALVMLKNRIEHFVLGLGIARSGAAHVTVSWRSTVPELTYLARHSGAEAVFFDADVAETIREAAPLLRDIPRRNFVSVGGEMAGFPSLDELTAADHGHTADESGEASLVMYTSGTTGKPKGAVRKLAGGALAAAYAFFEQTPLGLDEVHLTVCPVYHATATGFSTFTFLLGGTVVVLADFRPEGFLEAVERYRITSTALVPTMIHRLVELGPEALRARDLASLRAIFSGGAQLPGTLAIEAMDALGDRIYNFYGATETGIVTVATPADLRAAPGTIGRAIPGTDIRLVDELGRDVPEGAVGELYARNAMMVEGYHADAEATRSSMLDGYFSVGDLARRDHLGRLHIEGRKRDMIISGGVNVYPAEVEAAVEAHPAVAEVAVVGAPDREWGERVRAFVVRRPGRDVSADELQAHCRARLSGPKVPRDFVFLEALPRNPTGKVLKRELQAMNTGER
jgi:fatty-acyl-CoA synthase